MKGSLADLLIEEIQAPFFDGKFVVVTFYQRAEVTVAIMNDMSMQGLWKLH